MPSFGNFDPDFISGLRSRGLVSPRSLKRSGLEDAINSAAERGGGARGMSRAAAIEMNGRRDESSRSNVGAITSNHLDDDAQQAGGRVSKSGGAGRERAEGADHINAKRNRRVRLPSLNSASVGYGKHVGYLPGRSLGTEHYQGKDGSYGTLMGDPEWREE